MNTLETEILKFLDAHPRGAKPSAIVGGIGHSQDGLLIREVLNKLVADGRLGVLSHEYFAVKHGVAFCNYRLDLTRSQAHKAWQGKDTVPPYYRAMEDLTDLRAVYEHDQSAK